MLDEALVRQAITVITVLAVASGFVIFVLPLHPRLPGWKTWQEHKRADERAERLLRDVLGEDQYQHFCQLGYIEVPSQAHPGRVYRIGGWLEKVVVVEHGRTIGVLCAEVMEDVPAADVVLTHKLMLEGDEEEYLRIANSIP